VKYLLASGADVNLVTSRQDTALHWASKFSNEQVVRFLIEYKSNVNAVNSLQYTPLCGIGNDRLSSLIFFLEFCRSLFLWKF
jgi:ankyrin repeat protein